MLLSVVIVLVFFWTAFSKPKLVPRGMQNLGELGVLFVRDQILRPQMGKKGDKWLPFLLSLFFLIWVNNIMGIIPILYFPAMSKYGYAVVLAAMVWLIYMGLGFKKQGLRLLADTDSSRPGRPGGSSRCWSRSSSSRTSSSGRSRCRSDCSPTCWPATCCCSCSRWRPGTC